MRNRRRGRCPGQRACISDAQRRHEGRAIPIDQQDQIVTPGDAAARDGTEGPSTARTGHFPLRRPLLLHLLEAGFAAAQTRNQIFTRLHATLFRSTLSSYFVLSFRSKVCKRSNITRDGILSFNRQITLSWRFNVIENERRNNLDSERCGRAKSNFCARAAIHPVAKTGSHQFFRQTSDRQKKYVNITSYRQYQKLILPFALSSGFRFRRH